MDPARTIAESLTPRPGIREQHRPAPDEVARQRVRRIFLRSADEQLPGWIEPCRMHWPADRGAAGARWVVHRGEWMLRKALALLALVLVGSGTAQAQSVRDVLSDFGLLGSWKTDCSQQPAPNNFLTVYEGL